MIYLSTATSQQTFTFIPREFAINVKLEIRDEQTGDLQTQNLPLGSLSGFSSLTVALSLLEGRFYELSVTSIGSNWDSVSQFWNLLTINWEQGITRSGSAWNFATNDWNDTTGNWDTVRQARDLIIYKDRVFCTNQTISQGANEYYDPTKGAYKIDASRNNKYKVYNG